MESRLKPLESRKSRVKRQIETYDTNRNVTTIPSPCQPKDENMIKVFCRFRPPRIRLSNKIASKRHKSYTPGEKVNTISNNFMFSKDHSTVRFVSGGIDNYENVATRRSSVTDFMFDQVFQPISNQTFVYQNSAYNSIKNILNGFNSTLLVYGQTGSGKTYTMFGNNDAQEAGIFPRLTKSLFDNLNDQSNNYEVEVSVLENYKEKITDLLGSTPGNAEEVSIRQHAHQIILEGASQIKVNDKNELLTVVQSAISKRKIGSHLLNHISSRSHLIINLFIRFRKHNGQLLNSKLVLVDLAGSELSKKTRVLENETLFEESKAINKSLSALGNVIKALIEKKQHIPYRDSKLTRVLQPSLGGNSKTTFIVCCSAAATDINETISTLRFGRRAQKVYNKPQKYSHQKEKNQLNKLKSYISTLRHEISSLSVTSTQQEKVILAERAKNNKMEHRIKELQSEIKEKICKERKYRPRNDQNSIVLPKFLRRQNSSGKEEQVKPALVQSFSVAEQNVDVSFVSTVSQSKSAVKTTEIAIKPQSTVSEDVIVKLTKNLIEMQRKLAKKSEELDSAKKLLTKKRKSYNRFGFLPSRVENKEFLEIIKKKDEAINDLEEKSRDLDQQLKVLEIKLTQNDMEKLNIQTNLESSDNQVKFLRDTLRESGRSAQI